LPKGQQKRNFQSQYDVRQQTRRPISGEVDFEIAAVLVVVEAALDRGRMAQQDKGG
jgi:hypothetical protein